MNSPLPSHGRHSNAPRVRNALMVVLAANLLVVIIKIVVGVETHALTVLGSALESTLDMLNNILGMVLVVVAGREPDEDHPYGHEKFEALGTLAIVMFLSTSCFELLREAVFKLLHLAQPTSADATEFAFMIGTAFVNAFVVWFERRRGKALDSTFLMADSAHTGGDLYITLLALLSLGLTRLGWGILDAPIAIVIALLIARNGFVILKGSVPILVDQRAIDAAEIRRTVKEIPQVVDVPTVRSRSAPSGLRFAEVTISVPGGLTVTQAHEIADAVEAHVAKSLRVTEVIVHIEPAA